MTPRTTAEPLDVRAAGLAELILKNLTPGEIAYLEASLAGHTRPSPGRAAVAPGLVEHVVAGLSPETASTYRRAYAAFARHLGVPTDADALGALASMNPEDFHRSVESFRGGMRASGLSEWTVRVRTNALRTAARVLKAAGLSRLDTDAGAHRPGVERGTPGGLLETSLAGLTPRTVRCVRQACSHLAEWLGVGTSDDALRTLIALGDDEGRRCLERYRSELSAGGLAPGKVKARLGPLRTAVRALRAAGAAGVDFDVRGGRPRVRYDPNGPTAVCLRRVKPSTAQGWLRAFASLARFLGRPGPDDALRQLVGLDRGRAGRVLEDFGRRLRSDGSSPWTVTAHVSALRSAVRALRDAGLADFDVDVKLGPPRPEYEPGGLIDTCMSAFSPATAAAYLCTYGAYAKSMKARAVDEAIRSLIGMSPDSVERAFKKFRRYEVERGITPEVISNRVGHMRSAVRALRAAGLTELDVDVERGRPQAPYASGGLVDSCLSAMTASTAAQYLRTYRAFADFMRVTGPDEALKVLIELDRDDAEAVLSDFKDYLLSLGSRRRGMAAPGGLAGKTAEGKLLAINSAVRTLRERGLTGLNVSTPYQPAWARLVVLTGPDAQPRVLGRQKPKLSRECYQVLQALLLSGETGLTNDELRARSGRGDAGGVVERLRVSGPDWCSVIHRPLKKGGRNRIGAFWLPNHIMEEKS